MKTTKNLLCAVGLVGLVITPSPAATVETPGFLKYECWFPPLRDASFVGTTVSVLLQDPNYPTTPDMVSYAAGTDSRGVFPDDSHEQYGAKLSGWFSPAVTGDYNFYIKSDDSSELYISTDATEANLVIAAAEAACCNPFQEPGANQTTATPLHMEAGQKYFVQILLKEGGGGDFVQVAVQSATGTIPAAQLQPFHSTMVSSLADPAGASLSITQQPANTSTPENVAVTFSVAATAVTPFGQYTGGGTPTLGGTAPLGTKAQLATFYQWFTNGVEVAGQNGSSYTIQYPKAVQTGMKVKCYVAVPGIPLYSSEATLTVTADTVPPTIAQAVSDASLSTVFLSFSEPVNDTALAASNYTLNQGATVSSVTRVDLTKVKLTTSKLTSGATYTLTVSGVQDSATVPNTIAPNSSAQFRAFVFLAGTILHQKYTGFNDTSGFVDNNLFTDPRYPTNPDRRDLLARWEYPRDGVARDNVADPARMYMDTIEGFFIAPQTGDYVFFTCGADRFSLYLSTDETPANKHLIATISGWTNPRNWITGQATDMTPARSDTFPGTEWPGGAPAKITLTQGKQYYMLSTHYDPSWSGADDFAVTYKLASDADPVDGDMPKLTSSVIGYNFDPTGASISFTQQPQNTSVVEGQAASLSAVATGTSIYGTTVLYQWQSAPKGSTTWTSIASGTSDTYKTPLLSLTDDGTQYRVIATLAPITQTSSVATVTVLPDTVPPVPTVGAMLDSVAGTVDVGVIFDESVDNTSASLLANYSVSPGTIASIDVYTNRFTANSQNPLVMAVKHSILLKVTGVSGSGTLTIKNVADLHGNVMPATAVPFTVGARMQWGVVGANELGFTNAVVPVSTNGFDVYSDGIGEWATYDEATFVYEQVTGDFDKKLRVEYQDGSSQWARAGLIVRDVTNFGVDRTAQSGGVAGRYQKCHVNPTGATLTGPGNPGNNSWEGNRRLDAGGSTTTAGGGGAPQYPNAWCRIKRVGQTFTIFRSDDGVNWNSLGSTTWGVDDTAKLPMPATVYVGPEFSPENGNIPQTDDQGTFLARFRDYGDFVAAFDPQLKIGVNPTTKQLSIQWTAGTLVSSPTVNGTYGPVTGAVSPYVVTPTEAAAYYRVKQ